MISFVLEPFVLVLEKNLPDPSDRSICWFLLCCFMLLRFMLSSLPPLIRLASYQFLPPLAMRSNRRISTCSRTMHERLRGPDEKMISGRGLEEDACRRRRREKFRIKWIKEKKETPTQLNLIFRSAQFFLFG